MSEAGKKNKSALNATAVGMVVFQPSGQPPKRNANISSAPELVGGSTGTAAPNHPPLPSISPASSPRDVGQLSDGVTALDSSSSKTRGNRTTNTLGRYRIVKLLGRGGMAAVYEGRDPDNHPVAVKVLSKKLLSNAKAVQRFKDEAEAVRRLNHEGVVRVYDIGNEGKIHYIVMELLAGGTLAAYLKARGAFPWTEATRITLNIARALDSAHSLGIVHRDIKPANMLVRDWSETPLVVKLADFGLAKVHDPADGDATMSRGLTQTGQVLGTPEYMSPEQCQCEPLDARTDLYSLGATYFALLTGRPPYPEAKSTPQAMFAHCYYPVPNPRDIVPEVPEGCFRIIRKAMAKALDERYPFAQRLIEDLESLLANPEQFSSEQPATSDEWNQSINDAVSFRRRSAPTLSGPGHVGLGIPGMSNAGLGNPGLGSPGMNNTGLANTTLPGMGHPAVGLHADNISNTPTDALGMGSGVAGFPSGGLYSQHAAGIGPGTLGGMPGAHPGQFPGQHPGQILGQFPGHPAINLSGSDPTAMMGGIARVPEISPPLNYPNRRFADGSTTLLSSTRSGSMAGDTPPMLGESPNTHDGMRAGSAAHTESLSNTGLGSPSQARSHSSSNVSRPTADFARRHGSNYADRSVSPSTPLLIMLLIMVLMIAGMLGVVFMLIKSGNTPEPKPMEPPAKVNPHDESDD